MDAGAEHGARSVADACATQLDLPNVEATPATSALRVERSGSRWRKLGGEGWPGVEERR